MEREEFVQIAPLDGLLVITPPSAPAARSMTYLWMRYLAGMFLLLLVAFFLLLLYDAYRETRPAPLRPGPATTS